MHKIKKYIKNGPHVTNIGGKHYVYNKDTKEVFRIPYENKPLKKDSNLYNMVIGKVTAEHLMSFK